MMIKRSFADHVRKGAKLACVGTDEEHAAGPMSLEVAAAVSTKI
jgi:hypothetical protein